MTSACRQNLQFSHVDAVHSSGVVHGYVVNSSKQSRMSGAVLLNATYLMVHISNQQIAAALPYIGYTFRRTSQCTSTSSRL